MRCSVTLLVTLALALALVSCVDDVTVVDDVRSRQACEAALLLRAPSVGCTTVQVASTDPWGCGGFPDDGGGRSSLAGSWVHLVRADSQAATLRLSLVSSPSCDTDAGSGCGGVVLLGSASVTPCTCAVPLEPLYVETTLETPLVATSQEILLQPFGAVFDLTLCDASAVGP